jgi:hypothetical protein
VSLTARAVGLPSALPPATLPALVAATGDRAVLRFLEFFAAAIRNPHTRRAYGRAVAEFLAWCEQHGVPSLTAVQPLHVAAWIEAQTRALAARRHRHSPVDAPAALLEGLEHHRLASEVDLLGGERQGLGHPAAGGVEQLHKVCTGRTALVAAARKAMRSSAVR